MTERRPRLSELCEEFFLYLTSFRRRVDEELDPDVVREGLKAALRRVETAAADHGRAESFKRIKYQLVVTADHVIFHSRWRHARTWLRLEIEEYKTSVGGDRFFELMDKMHDPEELEVCYLCIALGFEGKHRGDPDKLADIRRAKYLALHDVPKTTDKALFTEQAYKETLERSRPVLPVVRVARLAIVLLGLAVFLYFGAGFAYDHVVEDLVATAKEIADLHEERLKPSED